MSAAVPFEDLEARVLSAGGPFERGDFATRYGSGQLAPDPLADPRKRAAYYGAAALLPESEDPRPSRFLCLACMGTGGEDLGQCAPCRGYGSVDVKERARQQDTLRSIVETMRR